MFCLIALIVFSILGIFSVTHRQLAKEAFDCVFRRITLRPCNTGFDQKIKGKIVGRFLNKFPKLAKSINRFWEPIAWLLVIVFFASMFLSGQAVYNLVQYKTCDPVNPQNCILSTDIDEECSPSNRCDPCGCGVDGVNCQSPDYTSCGGEENCDCNISCEMEE